MHLFTPLCTAYFLYVYLYVRVKLSIHDLVIPVSTRYSSRKQKKIVVLPKCSPSKTKNTIYIADPLPPIPTDHRSRLVSFLATNSYKKMLCARRCVWNPLVLPHMNTRSSFSQKKIRHIGRHQPRKHTMYGQQEQIPRKLYIYGKKTGGCYQMSLETIINHS